MPLQYQELRLVVLTEFVQDGNTVDESQYTLAEDSFYRNLWGNQGSDTLQGNSFDNVLNGDAGADSLTGGAGNDTYRVDDPGDVVVELAGGGIDTVITTIDYTLDDPLRAHIENVILDGDGSNLVAIGNSLNNTLTGNAGDNYMDGLLGNDRLLGGVGADTLLGGGGNDILHGGTGIDEMTGGVGNDTYYVDVAGDLVIEASGGGTADRVYTTIDYSLVADVEQLYASGTGSINLTGNALANTIYGNGGANRINGDLGKDVLKGGAGKDTFIFSTKLSSSNVDKISDYNVTSDTVWLDNAIFTKLGSTGSEASPKLLSSSNFTIGPKAKDKTDYVVYDNANGYLYYDADGSGSGKAVLIATLSKNLKMTSGDFYVI
jgi:Ca2+-binding RTX toxin-like protein